MKLLIIFFRVIIVILTILISLGLIELIINTVGAKYIHIKTPTWINVRTNRIWGCYSLDPVTIYRPVPNENYPRCIETDKKGYRINPYAPARTGSGIVVFLGDSFTWGHGVDDEHTLPSQFQILLNNSGYDMRVINAGFPGFGTDQELVYFEHYILPTYKPKIVVWNIQENDWDDNNEACLYTVRGDKLLQHSGKLNTAYLLDSLYRYSPQFIRNTKLLWVLFSLIPERKTIGCSQNYRSAEYDDRKIVLEIEHMKELGSKYNFVLVVSYVQGQYGYTDIHKPDDYEETTARKLRAIRSAKVEPVVVSQSIKRISGGLTQIQLFPGSSATPSSDLSIQLFDENDKFPFGQKHMNELGNKLFADVLFKIVFQNR